MASGPQPGGPAWLVTEFGATKSAPHSWPSITAISMDAQQVGWVYWAWKYYGDPTGSEAESLVMADGRLRSTARVLSRAYPEAVAGVPISFGYSPASGVFHLAYVPNHRVHAPTVVFVPTELHYPHGYCAHASGPGWRLAGAATCWRWTTARRRHRGHRHGDARRLQRRAGCCRRG